MNDHMLSESQKISLITYKMRVNGSPYARCTGKDQNGKYIFENLNINQLELTPAEYNQIEEIISCLKDESKLRSVA